MPRWQSILQNVWRIARRVLAWAAVVISIIGVVVCIAGAIGCLIARAPLQDAAANGIARLDQALGRAEMSLTRVDAKLAAINNADFEQARITLSETVVNLNSALQSLDQIPFVDVPSIDTDRLQELDAQVQTSLATAAATGQAAEAKTSSLVEQVAAGRAQVQDFGASVSRWINIGTFALVFLFLWLALAQVCLAKVAWPYAMGQA